MDTREKFNIKQMVDCEKQEPFYPVTHAQAIKIIDNGEVKVLQDIISNILNFIHNMENFDPNNDLLTLGYQINQAFPGNEGKQLSDNLLPVCDDIDEAIKQNTEDQYKLASLQAIIDFVNNLTPDGTIRDGETKAVTGGDIYDFIDGLLHGSVSKNNDKLVTGGDVYEALQDIEDPIWETDSNHVNSIKQKSQTQVEDLGLQITNNNEVAIGKYNDSTLGETIFSVGSGDVGDRRNSIEVTNDIQNSLKIPYEDQGYVSIQAHMRNAQTNIKHLTQEQLNKLEELINDKWKPSYSFSASTHVGAYLDNNTGIDLSWNIKNSEGGSATILTDYTHLYKDNQEINNVPISSNGTYTISNYEDYSFNSNGKSKFTYKLVVVTDELASTGSSKELTDSVTLYAPSYMFTSTNDDLSTIPDNGVQIIRCTSLESFQGTISISNSNKEYIYIAVPTFTNIQEPTSNQQPFKDFDTGFQFNLSNEYFEETTKTFNICSKQVEVNYKIVRSNQLLDQNTTWTIAHRNK